MRLGDCCLLNGEIDVLCVGGCGRKSLFMPFKANINMVTDRQILDWLTDDDDTTNDNNVARRRVMHSLDL